MVVMTKINIRFPSERWRIRPRKLLALPTSLDQSRSDCAYAPWILDCLHSVPGVVSTDALENALATAVEIARTLAARIGR